MKKINPHIYPYLVVIVVSTIGLLFIHLYLNQKIEATNWKAKYDFQKLQYDSFLNQQGKKVVEQNVAVTYDEKEIKKVSAQIFDLKKSLERKIKEVNALVVANQRVVYKDSTKIYYEPYPYNYNRDSLVKVKDVIIPPRKFNTSNKNIAIAGTVLLDGVKIDSVQLNNTVSFRIAEKRKNIVSKKETIVQVINSNPYFNSAGLQSMVLKTKPNVWKNYIKPITIAIATLIIKNQVK